MLCGVEQAGGAMGAVDVHAVRCGVEQVGGATGALDVLRWMIWAPVLCSM